MIEGSGSVPRNYKSGPELCVLGSGSDTHSYKIGDARTSYSLDGWLGV